jgi:hypothetical protein
MYWYVPRPLNVNAGEKQIAQILIYAGGLIIRILTEKTVQQL